MSIFTEKTNNTHIYMKYLFSTLSIIPAPATHTHSTNTLHIIKKSIAIGLSQRRIK